MKEMARHVNEKAHGASDMGVSSRIISCAEETKTCGLLFEYEGSWL